ncbi:PHB depolymerase esterase [Massilia sp. Root418]|jgi:poly(hydroxyalkanoate) depolymerase family esterase|uniref:extracellular catalytic domain type 1 short-chain-length polyhydroxyalkanoate depolymerase n=1 Tax=Massilia sp. Root418 TaxID=1736532 RepID=UPI0006F784A5|nr:PHB depolymerase family esterase [Massilia sp. Root418]KQW96909.1 PHB depolymerase esterase [Massilia sp. Root418]
MAKPIFGARLLRSMARAGKSQQKLMTQLFGVPAVKAKPKAKSAKLVKPAQVAAKPANPARRTSSGSLAAKAAAPVRRALPAAPDGMPIRQHARPEVSVLPGRWLASHYAAMPQPGQVPAQPMSYWLYLPHNVPAAAARAGLPLIVMLHGCHQSATQFAQGTRMNRLAEQKGYAVLYPQQAASTQAHRCWRWYDKSTQEGGGDTALIAAVIAKVCSDYAIDRRRIYVAGISAGAGMANILALNHPELIAAIGLHSGPAYGGGHSTVGALTVMQHGAGVQASAAIRQVLRQRPGFPVMPTILIQGEGDKVVRPINQAQLVQQSLLLNRLPAGTEVTVVERARRGHTRNAHEIRDYSSKGKVLLRVARIAELEHAWSGGDPALSFNAKPGPDASKMMLDFFAKHRRLVA